MLKINKKGLTSGELAIFLVVALLLVGSGILFFYNYSKSNITYRTEYILLDDSFNVVNMTVTSTYVTFNIKRVGGFEDYKGFQVFFEDLNGNVFSEDVYTQIELNEEKTITLNHKSSLNNLRFVTIIPIY